MIEGKGARAPCCGLVEMRNIEDAII